jgi:regulator of nucleoside diphosphate kinase
MRDRPIVITDLDAARLRGLIGALAHAQRDQNHLEELSLELERARVVRPDEVPSDVVTMHARVQVSDVTTGERRELVLVFSGQADLAAQRVSVLAPMGTALLGYREGDEVEWIMPGGLRRLRIEKVIQPALMADHFSRRQRQRMAGNNSDELTNMQHENGCIIFVNGDRIGGPGAHLTASRAEDVS